MNLFNRIHYSHLKTSNVTVSAPRPPEKKEVNTQGFILQVEQVVDLGTGGKTLSVKQLEGITAFDPARDKPHKAIRHIPQNLADMTLITTQKSQEDIVCIQSTLNYYFDTVQPQEITPDVLMPGDLIVIEYNRRGRASIQALRVIENNNKGNHITCNALPTTDTAG